MESFDNGRFALRREHDLGRMVLIEGYSEQKILLDDGRWVFGMHDGRAYVQHLVPGGRSVWCDDLFPYVVFRAGGSEDEFLCHLTDESAPPISLTDYRQKYQTVLEPILVTGRSTPIKTKIFVHECSRGGAYCYWSIQQIFDALFNAQAARTCSSWHQNWWIWWLKQLTKLGLEAELHLRKAPPYTRKDAEGSIEQLRYMPDAVMSSYAAIHLLTRWANDSKSKIRKDNDRQLAWLLFTQALIKHVLSHGTGKWEWTIFLDFHVDVEYGRPMQGNHPIRLPLRVDIVDLSPLIRADTIESNHAISQLGEIGNVEGVPLALLCKKFDQKGHKLHWLWKQFIWHIGASIENYILAQHGRLRKKAGDPLDGYMQADRVVATGAEQLAERRKMRLGKRMQMQVFETSDMKRVLIQAFYCIRRHWNDFQSMGFACDASRIGNRNRMCGFITLPSNLGVPTPPLAPRDWGPGSHGVAVNCRSAHACVFSLTQRNSLHKGIWGGGAGAPTLPL